MSWNAQIDGEMLVFVKAKSDTKEIRGLPLCLCLFFIGCFFPPGSLPHAHADAMGISWLPLLFVVMAALSGMFPPSLPFLHFPPQMSLPPFYINPKPYLSIINNNSDTPHIYSLHTFTFISSLISGTALHHKLLFSQSLIGGMDTPNRRHGHIYFYWHPRRLWLLFLQISTMISTSHGAMIVLKSLTMGNSCSLLSTAFQVVGFNPNKSICLPKLICKSNWYLATLQLSSQGPKHDEIDFEFLGNLSGDPYILHTNVFAQGLGGREQQFYLWFDPTLDFHTYSVLWTSNQIIFSVDGSPIRVFKNRETELGKVDSNYHYPKSQAMGVYSSLWNADDWATRGGLVKTDWTKAPFVASFRNFNAAATSSFDAAAEEALESNKEQRLQWVRKNYMIYDYCGDTKRFPQGPPPECK